LVLVANQCRPISLEHFMYSLISVWTIKRGRERAAVSALKRLAREVQKHEKKTLTYLVHEPAPGRFL
jgi:hypothetical protein